MTEWVKIFYTSIITILGSTIVFITGQIILKLFIEPICRQRQIIAEIDHAFKHYNHMFNNFPTDFMLHAAEDFRKLAFDIRTNAYTISNYEVWSNMKIVKPKVDILKTSDELINLSNELGRDFYGTVGKYEKTIHKLLNL